MAQKRSQNIPNSNIVDAGAVFSRCDLYRYAVWRCWNLELPGILFVGLNPSTANATLDDPTLRRCIDYAHRWGYGSVYIANLFAFRTTSPARLRHAVDPVGYRNNMWIRRLIKQTSKVLVAWGNGGSYRDRSEEVLKMIPEPYCLKINRSGQPAHPLYLPKSLTPKHFNRADLLATIG